MISPHLDVTVTASPPHRRASAAQPLPGILLAALLLVLTPIITATAETNSGPTVKSNLSHAGKAEPAKPTGHVARDIEGWKVLVDNRLAEPAHAEELSRALEFLRSRLFDIKVLVVPDNVRKLQQVSIVLDLTHGKLRPMQYHPDADWLDENGFSTNLVKCVHIPVIADLITARNINQQPMVILHELAHAYHDQVLGFEEPRILKAYEAYRKGGNGDKALLYNGTRVRHYGLTDQKEFFAEMTEAYFGMNDFFPFNRAELMTAEPEIFDLMQTIWGPVAGVPMISTAKVNRASTPSLRFEEPGFSKKGNTHGAAARH